MTDVKKPGMGGRALTASSKAHRVNANTHQGRVLHALRQRPMSAAELQWTLHIAHAPAAVRDLIAKGYKIDKVPDTSPQGRPIQRYRLIETD